jgi:hypothetical protein
LTYNLRLNGLDWLGNPIQAWLEHEGRCEEPIKRVQVKQDEHGKKTPEYFFNRETRAKYYIPFSKKAVDDLIEKTGTDRDSITYYVKFGEYPGSRAIKSRNNLYNYSQFVNSVWDKLIELDTKAGGPTGNFFPNGRSGAGVGVGIS